MYVVNLHLTATFGIAQYNITLMPLYRPVIPLIFTVLTRQSMTPLNFLRSPKKKILIRIIFSYYYQQFSALFTLLIQLQLNLYIFGWIRNGNFN